MGLKMKDDYVYIVKTIDNTLVGVATSEDEAKHMIQQVKILNILNTNYP